MSQIGQRYCEVCNMYISRKNFCQHLRTRRHMIQEISKQSQLQEKPPIKKIKLLDDEKTDAANKNIAVCEKPVINGVGNQVPNLSADDILHYIGELAKPLNDHNLPCNCFICIEAAKYMGLTKPDPTLDYSKEANISKQSLQLPELVNEKCIDFKAIYNNLIVFPPTYSADEEKMQFWTSMADFSKKFNASNNENKRNISLNDFSTASSTGVSLYSSAALARQQDTHHCCSFGKELPNYLKFSHCHEEMFHFFSIRDERTNYNVLFVVMK